MSASSKKKLRKEQNAAALTEKQRNEQKEAKKLKTTTIIFVVIMVAILAVALTVAIVNGLNNSVLIKKNTVALTVGEHEINSVEMNYYFVDAINSTYNQWSTEYGDYTSAYLTMMGLDVTKPLNKQTNLLSETEGQTWADYFLEMATEQATANYALYDQAIANGYTVNEEVQEIVENNVSMFSMYAAFAQTTLEDYMKLYYGNAASEESFREYMEVKALASTYYADYEEGLTYDEAAIRGHDAGREIEYNGYTYDNYYVSYSYFMPEDSADNPTAEQVAAASAEAKAAAEALVKATNLEELNAAIAALDYNAGTEAAATSYRSNLYTNISAGIRDWVSDSARQDGDLEAIPYESQVTDSQGNEVATATSYYVVLYHGCTENNQPMSTIRHLLVSFEKGEDGEVSKSENMDAKAQAEAYLKEWQSGEATEESFIEMISLYSDDTGSASNGGLYADITPDASYVDGFLDWCIDPARTEGEVAIVESEYGYHIMYFVSKSELTYRDNMIVEEMKAHDIEHWYQHVIDVEVLPGDLSKINTGLVIDANA